jgi:hypothetical protein
MAGSLDIDAAGDVVAGFGTALIVLKKRVVERDENGLRRKGGQIDNFDVEIAIGAFAVHGDVHGNHVGLEAENAADGGVAIFGKGSDGVAGVDDFECVQWRGESFKNFGSGHWK